MNGSVEIYSSTITNNSAVAGRNVHIIAASGSATVEVYSSIIAQADAPHTLLDFLVSPDTDGVLTVAGANNLIRRQNDYESITISSDDPQLGPLTDNGGPTPTHAVLPNSPAINQGSNPHELATDRRGAPHLRVAEGQADIGSFEWQTVNEPQLRGDYNENRAVDAADYVVWRKTLGSNVAPATGADDDGNGLVELLEYGPWRSNFGNRPESLATATGALATEETYVAFSTQSNHRTPAGQVRAATGSSNFRPYDKQHRSGSLASVPAEWRQSSLVLIAAADNVFDSLGDSNSSLARARRAKIREAAGSLTEAQTVPFDASVL